MNDSQPADATLPFRRLDQTPPLRQRVYEQIEGLIAAGTLAPGVRLVEGDLAQTLGVSRGPVREALQLLAQAGFVDLRSHQGAFVHVPTEKEIDDFFDVRRALESESARLATERLTPESAARLTGAVHEARAALDRGDDPMATTGNGWLHAEIADIADNPLLGQMLASLRKLATWYNSPFEPGLRRRAWQEHERIVEAIVAGDAEAAVAATIAHIEAGSVAYKTRGVTDEAAAL
jgi:DNA-binding GntR family transcriptional regulator